MILNLTPHPMHIYPIDTPDRIVAGSVAPILTLPACIDTPARLGEQPWPHGPRVLADDADPMSTVPVVDLTFGTGGDLPDPRPGVWYFVSRPVAMAAAGRADLLVPHLPIRDMDGKTLGARMLGRPVPAEYGKRRASKSDQPCRVERPGIPSVPAKAVNE